MSLPRIVFMGSPDFAVPALRALAEHYPVVGVITQPDRPAGRGMLLTAPPIKTLALSLAIPVIQPTRLREPAAWQQLQDWQPELIVVAAFGQILRPVVLDLPRFGCLNIHASLLPRWRGAAPVAAAILQGDEETGITIMRLDPGIDTGPTLSRRSIRLHPEDTAATLGERLAHLGAELLIETLPAFLAGDLMPKAQDETQATYAPMLKKDDGRLDFSLPAAALARRVRAFCPWPGAFFEWQGQTIKVHQADAAVGQGSIGQRLELEGLPAVACGQDILILEVVQPAGKKPMPASQFLRGARQWSSQA